MRLINRCMQCVQGGDIEKMIPAMSFIELRDDGRYELTCPQGHKSLTVLQQQRFEVLFEIGAYAIIDGYYREAIASFAASLERFYEFFIKTKLLQDKCTAESLDSMWKQISSQSERQLGAFVALYLQSFGTAPNLLQKSKVELRNKVIHSGKIPSREEALSFGQAVLDVVRPVIDQLTSKFPEGVQQMVISHIMNSAGQATGVPITTQSISTILGIITPVSERKPLVDSLDNLAWWRNKWSS